MSEGPGETQAAEGGALASATAITIAERAAALFAQKGFASTSIREIALAAGVTKPTVYYYFQSKQGLIEHLLDTSMRSFEETLARAARTESIERALHLILAEQLAFADERPATVTLLARLDTLPSDEIGDLDINAARERGHLAVVELFMAARARDELADHDPVLLTATFFGALVVHLMMRIQRPDIQLGSPDDVAAAVTRVFLDGARAPKSP